jgi:hypothetical protein
MIKYILSRLPHSIFNYVDSLIQIERLRREFPRVDTQLRNYNDSSVYTHFYNNCKIEVRNELEGNYISTWSVYDDKGEKIMSEDDDFYYSTGEAEKAAIEWLDSQEKN